MHFVFLSTSARSLAAVHKNRAPTNSGLCQKAQLVRTCRGKQLALETYAVVGLAALEPLGGGGRLPLAGNAATIACVPPSITIAAGQNVRTLHDYDERERHAGHETERDDHGGSGSDTDGDAGRHRMMRQDNGRAPVHL
jgi:hypothetical protein